MKRRKNCLLLFFFVFTSIILNPAFSQEKPRIAVLPFSALEVSEAEARVISSLFETALVKTEVYNVLEQNQISEILDAQAFSLSGCTDDACAVEVGELLSAELIVLGEISSVGGRYIANAKIIDVELGKNENADSVTADSIADMTDTQIGLLAYKLAGLTYTGGGAEVKIVENFSEVFINTEPDGADVYINGRLRGVSPVLIEKVPQGSVSVRAAKGNMEGEMQKSISGSDLVEIFINLEVTHGRMFIKSSVEDVDVLLDGDNKGPLKKDLYKEIPSGGHVLTLKGEGWFWEEDILIEKGKTLTVEAYPREMAVFGYNLPEGAEGVIEGRSLSEPLSGSGTLDLPAGTYSVTVTRPDHNPVAQEITLARADTFQFTPEMQLSQAYLDKQALEEYRAEFDTLSKWMEENPDNYKGQFDRFFRFHTKMDESGYDFPGLQDDVRTKALHAGRNRIDELDAMIAKGGDGWSKPQTIAFWSSVGAFVVGQTTGHLVYWLLAEPEREFYEDTVDGANTPALAEESHVKLATYRGISFSGFGLSCAGFSGALVTPFLGGNAFAGLWVKEKEDISQRMAEIRGGIEG